MEKVIPIAVEKIKKHLGSFSDLQQRSSYFNFNVLPTWLEKRYNSNALDDIARALIVFIYANFENTLRNILRDTFISQGMNKPLLEKLFGNKKIQEIKYNFDKLFEYREKNVKEIIELEILEHFVIFTCSKITQVTGHAEMLDIDTESELMKLFKPFVAKLIERRHLIVHEADLKSQGPPIELNTIDPNDIVDWDFASTGLLCHITLNIIDIYFPEYLREFDHFNKKIDWAVQHFKKRSGKN